MRTSKKNTKSRFNKKASAIIASILAILLVAGATAYFFYYLPHKSTVYSGDGNQTQYNNDKKASVNNADGKGASSPDAYTPPTTNSGIAITTDISNDKVIVHTSLSGYSDGTCTLKITNNGHTYTDTADVIYTPDSSLCAGFTVPISQLGNGSWQINLSVLPGGNTTSQQTTVEVSR